MVVAMLGPISPLALLACALASALCLFVVWQLRNSQAARAPSAVMSRRRGGSLVLLWAYRTVVVVVVLQLLAFLRYSFGSLSVDVYRLFLPVYYGSLILSAACLAIALVALAYVALWHLRRHRVRRRASR